MKKSNDFFDGVVAALAHLKGHDQPTMYDEIVQGCGEEEVIKAARRSGNLIWSGLSDYLYRKKHGGCNPRRRRGR